MRSPDVAWRLAALGVAAIVVVVALATAASLGLLWAWHEPLGGVPSGADALRAAIRARGAALQSAPQDARASEASR